MGVCPSSAQIPPATIFPLRHLSTLSLPCSLSSSHTSLPQDLCTACSLPGMLLLQTFPCLPLSLPFSQSLLKHLLSNTFHCPEEFYAVFLSLVFLSLAALANVVAYNNTH